MKLIRGDVKSQCLHSERTTTHAEYERRKVVHRRIEAMATVKQELDISVLNVNIQDPNPDKPEL